MGIRQIVSKLLNGSESSSQDKGLWVDSSTVQQIEPFTTGKVTRNFTATVSDELSVPKGTKVKAIYREDDWIYVHASDGKRGFVPQSYCRLNVDSPEVFGSKQRKASGKLHRSSSKKEPERASTTTINKYLHNDVNKSSLQRFLDSLPVKKDEGQPFHTEDLGKARVRYRYDAVKMDDINVWDGEEVIILNMDDPEWTYVRNKHNLKGFIPTSHLDIFEQKFSAKSFAESEPHLVIEDFDGRHALDITVEQGEWVTVISNDPDGWMWVRRLRDNSEGFMPSRMAILATNL